jgi:hypothetical protein
MNIILASTAVLLLLSGGIAHPETHDITVPITNLDASSSAPLRGTGQASFHEVVSGDSLTTQYRLEGALQNVSSKPILAFDAAVQLRPDFGGGWTREFTIDYFFVHQLLLPGSSFSLSESPRSRESIDYDGRAQKLPVLAQTRVTFVQFADGSTYGTSPWGQDLQKNRVAEITLFNTLLEAYQKGKGPGLSNAVADALSKPRSRAIDSSAHQINHDIMSKGADAVVEEIREFLANAKLREKSLKQE